MTMRKLTLGPTALALLLFAASSQAGELSLEISGVVADRAEESYASKADQDCANPGPSAIDSGTATVHTRSNPAVAAGRPAQAVGDATQMVGGSTTGASGATADSVGAPSKVRSNRWQSLVPGAIK